jgi:hypothetical protein
MTLKAIFFVEKGCNVKHKALPHDGAVADKPQVHSPVRTPAQLHESGEKLSHSTISPDKIACEARKESHSRG